MVKRQPDVLVINARSLAKDNAMECLEIEMKESCCDICTVTETWLTDMQSLRYSEIGGYVQFRHDRKQKRGGGITT